MPQASAASVRSVRFPVSAKLCSVIRRRLLLGAVGIPIVLGGMAIVGQQAGLYGGEGAPVLLAVSSSIVLAVLVWRGTRALEQVDSAVEALQQSQAFFQALFASSPDGVIVVDHEGRIVQINTQAVELFGYQAEDLLGQAVEILIPERFRHTHGTWRANYMAAPRARPMGTGLKLMGRRKDSSEFPVDVSLSPVETAHGLYVIADVRDISARVQTEEETRQLVAQLRMLAAHLQRVREEERTRIARELHDELGQVLTGLSMDLDWLERRLEAAGSGELRDLLLGKTQAMAQLLGTTADTIRRIISELRPGILDTLGLVAALEWQAQDFYSRTNIACTVHTELQEIVLDHERTTALFRVCQEALTNVARHAQASAVAIRLAKTDDAVVLEVHDNGRGVMPAELTTRGSVGLLGMQERARQLGGEVTITGEPGQGTTVTVRLPLCTGG